MESIFFALLKGVSLGFLLAVTSTGQAIICIQETLKRGLIYGLISGLGVAVADTFFSLAAGFGVGYVKAAIQSYGSIMHISGASLILIFGIVMFAGKSEIE
jgi:threonine/homoserine/homoserine lactone efflux protein